MIWFACPKCAKTLSRAESAAGALVFCDCGASIRVPWESTAPPQLTAPVPAVEVSDPLAPIRFDRASEPTPSAPDISLPRRRRSGEKAVEHNPAMCFNHVTEPKQAACAECKLEFCSRCLTSFQGRRLCGPCKNYQARLLQLRPPTSVWATASGVVALLGGAATLATLPSWLPSATWLTATLVLTAPLLALGAGAWTLLRLRGQPENRGIPWAACGVSVGATIVAATLLLTAFATKLTS